jgi:hypothetical protein
LKKAHEHDGIVQYCTVSMTTLVLPFPNRESFVITDCPCSTPALINAPKMVDWRWPTWNILVVALLTIHAQISLPNAERLD